jgi:hypothetical protein
MRDDDRKGGISTAYGPPGAMYRVERHSAMTTRFAPRYEVRARSC